MALSDGSAIEVVWTRGGTRIVCTDSMGHADERLNSEDVLVAGSHSAACAVELLLHLRLRGVIGHSAGPGLDDAGISGLPVLSRAGVPGAAVSTAAPIADGRGMYDHGVICAVNDIAESIGVRAGMSVRDAAETMATRRAQPVQVKKVQHLVHQDERGVVLALDTIGHGDERINGTVLCMGSHSGTSMADYLEQYDVLGTITNDAGMPPQRSSVAGMDRLAERGIPSAVVENMSARLGDGRSTWETGIVSEVNAVAIRLGINPGLNAKDAAMRMLAASR